MFKAITLAGALTLAEAARSRQTNPDSPQIDEKCKERDVSGPWTWVGGENNGETVDLAVYNELLDDADAGNAHWTFVCTLRYEDEETGEVYIFHEIKDEVNGDKLE